VLSAVGKIAAGSAVDLGPFCELLDTSVAEASFGDRSEFRFTTCSFVKAALSEGLGHIEATVSLAWPDTLLILNCFSKPKHVRL
jgi:hypothetical protein